MLWKSNLISQDKHPVWASSLTLDHLLKVPQPLPLKDLLIQYYNLILNLITLDIVQSSHNYNQVNCVKNYHLIN